MNSCVMIHFVYDNLCEGCLWKCTGTSWSEFASLGYTQVCRSYAYDLPSQNTLICSPPFILSEWHFSGWIWRVWDVFAVKNAATNFSGWETKMLVHTLPLTIWSHRFDSLPVSTSFHRFGADTTFIMLHNVTSCNWVSSGLDERIQQLILNGFQVRIALRCLPATLRLEPP